IGEGERVAGHERGVASARSPVVHPSRRDGLQESLLTALVIALAAAVVGAAIVIAVGRKRFTFGRGRSAADADELRRTQFELRWARQLSALSETLDLDELLVRVLQGAALLADADAAAVGLWAENEPPIVKAMNLTADEALPLLGAW